MRFSTGFRRFLSLSILFLLLSIALAPFAAITADPGNSTEPVPGQPPTPCSPGDEGIGASLALRGLVIDVVTAVIL